MMFSTLEEEQRFAEECNRSHQKRQENELEYCKHEVLKLFAKTNPYYFEKIKELLRYTREFCSDDGFDPQKGSTNIHVRFGHDAFKDVEKMVKIAGEKGST